MEKAENVHLSVAVVLFNLEMYSDSTSFKVKVTW